MKVQALQLANAQQMAQQRALRQQRQAEITDAALDVANQYIQRLRNRQPPLITCRDGVRVYGPGNQEPTTTIDRYESAGTPTLPPRSRF